jgi:acyl-coenzyme A thioesterase PaaI-like protein
VRTDAEEYSLLADALRRLLDVAVDARTLDGPTLARAAHAIDEVSAEIEAARDEHPLEARSIPFDGQRVPMPSWRYELDDRGLVARGQFSNGHTGPPGTVHGGWIAFAFDEILGWANVHAGFPSMTGKLTIRYRKPTPIGAPVEFSIPKPRVEGKRVHVHATLSVDGSVTAEAEGLFVHFKGHRRSPAQEW